VWAWPSKLDCGEDRSSGQLLSHTVGEGENRTSWSETTLWTRSGARDGERTMLRYRHTSCPFRCPDRMILGSECRPESQEGNLSSAPEVIKSAFVVAPDGSDGKGPRFCPEPA